MVYDEAVEVWPFEVVVDWFAADCAGWVSGADCFAVAVSGGCAFSGGWHCVSFDGYFAKQLDF